MNIEDLEDVLAEMDDECGDMYDGTITLNEDRYRSYIQRIRDSVLAAPPRDCAKLREAVVPFPSLCEWLIDNAAKIGIQDMVPKLRERLDLAKSALAAPARNCDVGTAEEQEARYRATGEVYHTLTLRNALTWAQMPCDKDKTKGDADGSK